MTSSHPDHRSQHGQRPIARRAHIQLWSYNYDPEPTGIGPISTRWATAMRDRGHRVEVVAAHPHYPTAVWGIRWRPYREVREGIPVLRLPLAIGRATAGQRVRQELSYASCHLAALPFLGRPDVVIAVSPSFPALLPAVINARFRSVPLILWLKDLLPDGAVATELLAEDDATVRAARRLERAAYRTADRMVVISRPFIENLRQKGVDHGKISLVNDPASRPIAGRPASGVAAAKVLSMGNIGYSQGLAPLVGAFEESSEMAEQEVGLTITGDGVAAPGVRAQIRSERVEMPGVVEDQRLEQELRTATLALVSQEYEGSEFNLPSKLMNFMGYGIPIVAAVNPASEVARLVREAQAGWVVDSSRPREFPVAVARALDQSAGLAAVGDNALRYAREHFSLEACAESFERLIAQTVPG